MKYCFYSFAFLIVMDFTCNSVVKYVIFFRHPFTKLNLAATQRTNN